jgi:L-lactate utilization protein LutC
MVHCNHLFHELTKLGKNLPLVRPVTAAVKQAAQSGQGRSVSLVPPLHVALLEPSQIVPDLFDLFRELETHKAEFPSNITLITGPSKTGDIQLKLTTGVHGPGEVHAVVIESA